MLNWNTAFMLWNPPDFIRIDFVSAAGSRFVASQLASARRSLLSALQSVKRERFMFAPFWVASVLSIASHTITHFLLPFTETGFLKSILKRYSISPLFGPALTMIASAPE